jgi:hypothetical protein
LRVAGSGLWHAPWEADTWVWSNGRMIIITGKQNHLGEKPISMILLKSVRYFCQDLNWINVAHTRVQ